MHRFNSNNRRRFLLPLSSVCAACVGLASPALAQDTDDDAGEPVVKVSDFETVDLAVQDADLAQVLQMLSLQSRKNIITSRNVSATVSANLYDVTFYEALDAILRVNGYTYNEEGNFIYVYTIEEWSQIQDEQRERVSRTFRLDHLAPQDALNFIMPTLTDGGNATARGEVLPGMQPSMDDAGADGYAGAPMLVVFDYPENLDAIAALIDELDTAPDQVMVESTILQTTVDEANAFGIDFSIVAGMDFSDVINPLSPVLGLLNGSDSNTGFQPADNEAFGGQSTVGNTTGPGGFKVGLVSNDISVFLRALDQVTDTTVLARPKIMALNRQRAEVLVGARVGYLSTTATETTTTQTVEFLDTGIQLVFRPFIAKDGTIRMELRPSVSEASLRTVTDSLGVQVTIPDELTNELTTNVRVRDGQTLILGGLFREATNITRRQVPLLGDIPVLGAAFRGQDDRVERSEIIFLITPTITKDEVLWENGAEALAYAELVRIGSREGLLPFSRERMTASHNQQAVAAAKAGNTELALHHTRTSLRLNPNQPTVIALQQELTGEVDRNYERSMLERIMHKGVERHLNLDPVSYSKVETTDTPHFQRNPLIEVHQISDQPEMLEDTEPTNIDSFQPADASEEFPGFEFMEDAPAETEAPTHAPAEDFEESMEEEFEPFDFGLESQEPDDEWSDFEDFSDASADDAKPGKGLVDFWTLGWSRDSWWVAPDVSSSPQYFGTQKESESVVEVDE